MKKIYKKETILDKIGHYFDFNVFLLLLLDISYVMCYSRFIKDSQVQTSIINTFSTILYVTTALCLVYAVFKSIDVLKTYYPKKIKMFILFTLLFLSFYAIYYATFYVYFTGGQVNNLFIMIIGLMMIVFGILFFDLAIALTAYGMMMKSKKDFIKMILVFILSLYLFVEISIFNKFSPVATYVSNIDILAIFYLSISTFMICNMKMKSKNAKLFEKDTIIALLVFIIGAISIYVRDYDKIIQFFYMNIFNETYDLVLNYTLMIVLALVFFIIIIRNYKKLNKKIN